MNQTNKLQKAVNTAYVTVSLFLAAFLLYMCCAEHNVIYQARKFEKEELFDGYLETTMTDASAPVGIRRNFSWELTGISTTKDHVAFYIVHHYAEVYIDGELIYSLQPAESNRIGASPGSNWVFVPLEQTDNGKEIRIVLTPVYHNVQNREVEFILGSRNGIVLQCLEEDLLQLILALLCIFIGLALMLVHPILTLLKKPSSWGLFYLGDLLETVGVWRITDIRFTCMFLPEFTMPLGYITLSMLLISVVPLFLFIKNLFPGRKKNVLLLTALAVCFNAAFSLLLELLGIAELRETLVITHAMLLLCATVMIAMVLFYPEEDASQRGLRALTVMVAVGGLMDLLTYYLSQDSRGLVFTVLALFLYTVQKSIGELCRINKRGYLDVQTGLYNRNRWNDFLKKAVDPTPDTGVIMLDLNRLKCVNDSMGHKSGDKMIRAFVDILRENLPADCTIFRWGGDEFTVLMQGADREKLEACLKTIRTKTTEYNCSGQRPEIYFAAGYVLAADHPGLSYEELMKKADERMYRNKSAWYRKNAGGKPVSTGDKDAVGGGFA